MEAESNSSGGAKSSPVSGHHVIVTVHGIRTYGQWQTRLGALVSLESPQTIVYAYRYGYFSVLAFMFPLVRILVVRRFQSWLEAILQKGTPRRIDFVAHSFGTYLVAWTILRLAQQQQFQCHTVVLCGSVLKSNFRWDTLLGIHIKRLVNDCGVRDGILLLNQLFILFSGMAGRVGFVGGERTGEFANRYFDFGHSDYFWATREYSHEDAFMREAWLPLLVSDTGIREFPDRRPELTAVRGVGSFVLNNLEPIKLMLWTAPFVIVTLIFSELRSEAEKQSRTAQARFLASESVRFQAAFPQRSLLLAAKSVTIGLRNGPSIEPVAEEQIRRVLAMTSGIGLQLTKTGEVTDLATCGDADRAVAVTSDGWLAVVNSTSLWHQKPVTAIRGHDGAVLGLLPKADCSEIATAGRDGMLRVWTVDDGRTLSLKVETALGVKDAALFARTRTGHVAIGSKDGSLVAVLDAIGRRRVIQLNSGVELASIAVSEDGRWLVAGGATTASDVYHWDLTAESPQSSQRAVDCHDVTLVGSGGMVGVHVLRFDPTGKWLLSGGTDGAICRYSIEPSGLDAPMKHGGPKKLIKDIAFGLDAVAVVGSEPILPLGHLGEGSAVTLMGSQGRPVKLASASLVENAHKVAASEESHLYAWATPSGEIGLGSAFDKVRSHLGHEGAVTLMEFSRDGKWLWSGSKDGSVRIWSALESSPHDEPRSIEKGVITREPLTNPSLSDVAFSANGQWLVASKESRTVLWRRDDLSSWTRTVVIEGSPARFDADGQRLFVGLRNDSRASVGVWGLNGRELSNVPDLVLDGHWGAGAFDRRGVREIATSAKANLIAIGDNTGTVSLRDTKTLAAGTKPLLLDAASTMIDNKEILGPGADSRALGFLGVSSLALDEQGSWLFTGTENGRARLWKVDPRLEHVEPTELAVFEGPVTNAKFISSLSAVFAVSGSSLLSWAISDPAVKTQRHLHAAHISSFQTSPQALATASDDGDIQLTRISGRRASTIHLRRHDSPVVGLAFSADGSLLGSVDKTGRAILWEVGNTRSRMLDDGSSKATSIAIDPATKQLAIGTELGALKVWEADPARLVCLAVRRAGRSLSALEVERFIDETPSDKALLNWVRKVWAPSGAGRDLECDS